VPEHSPFLEASCELPEVVLEEHLTADKLRAPCVGLARSSLHARSDTVSCLRHIAIRHWQFLACRPNLPRRSIAGTGCSGSTVVALPAGTSPGVHSAAPWYRRQPHCQHSREVLRRLLNCAPGPGHLSPGSQVLWLQHWLDPSGGQVHSLSLHTWHPCTCGPRQERGL
jgi:hypothetical protein